MVSLKNFKGFICLALAFILILGFAGCSSADKNYGVSQDTVKDETAENKIADLGDNPIMSSDRVMSNYFDISLFDEENYSDVYLGKKFKLKAEFLNTSLEVPCKLSDMEAKGWLLDVSNSYNAESMIFPYETVDALFVNSSGVILETQFYNSSRSSVTFGECYLVKIKINNNFYNNTLNYSNFIVNDITNTMAITDIINTLGVPSHFYRVSEDSYYLDYFITKKDRRNGITVYINPIDDLITSIEFSYYK